MVSHLAKDLFDQNRDASRLLQGDTSRFSNKLACGSVGVMNDENIDDPFSLGLRVVMEARGIKPAPLATAAGLGNSAVRDLFRKGASPKLTTASALADQLGLTIAQVIEAGRVGHIPSDISLVGSDLVPVYNVTASAGPGAILDWEEEIVEKLAFPSGYLRRLTSVDPIHLAIISVKGRSMEPTLREDDVVMIDTSKRDLSYEGVFVIRDGGNSMLVKRISRASRRGYILLVSDNRDHPPVERSLEDIEVIGKVVWAGVKM